MLTPWPRSANSCLLHELGVCPLQATACKDVSKTERNSATEALLLLTGTVPSHLTKHTTTFSHHHNQAAVAEQMQLTPLDARLRNRRRPVVAPQPGLQVVDEQPGHLLAPNIPGIVHPIFAPAHPEERNCT